MWISKKKLLNIKQEAFIKSLNDRDETEQWNSIAKLEKQVKKLKKQIKEGY